MRVSPSLHCLGGGVSSIYSCWCDQIVCSLEFHPWIVSSLHHSFVVGTMPTQWRGAHVSLETVFWCWQTQSTSNFCLPVVKRDSCMWLGVYWLSDLNHKCFPINCAVFPVCLRALVTPPRAAARGSHCFGTGLLLLSSSLASWGGGNLIIIQSPFRIWDLLSGRDCRCKNSAVSFTPTCEFLLEGAEYWEFWELMAQVGYKIHNQRHCLSWMHVSSSVSLEDHHGPVWNEKNCWTASY